MKKNYLLPIVLVCLFSLTSLAQTTWDGSDSADWHTAANWDTNSIPTSTDNVVIANAGTAPIISSGTLAETLNLTINTGATLTINSANSLTVSGNLTITDNDSFILNSGSSLIVNGTSTGNITYNRTLATNNWYLVASPVVGETVFDLISNAGDISNNGSDFAIGTYNDGWTYNYSATLGSGWGYAVKKDASGNLPFTGTIQTSDVAKTTVDTTDDFNLYGNPYPSYIPANENADANNNFLTVNTASGQDELDSATIWFWDQATDGYIQINQGSPARFIAPSQGFFIKNKGSFGDTFIDFKESMQSHQSTEVFNKSVTTRQDIKLFLSDGTKNKYTEIYYIDGATTGYDNGYDSSIFGGTTHPFSIFTELVTSSNTGKKLGIQSLPNSNFENMVIPIGINADSGLNIKFTAEVLNLPNGINVYLEDRLKDTYARLDETNSNYSITLTENLSGFGRFYLHTKSSSTLNADDIALEGTSVYQLDKNSLRITGINSDNARIKIYSILGKQVLDYSFSSKGNSDITLPNLNTGVYIVQVATEKGKINKKIILE